MTTSTMLRLPLKVFDEDIRQVVILDADGNWVAKVDTQWAGPFAPRSMAQQIVKAVNAYDHMHSLLSKLYCFMDRCGELTSIREAMELQAEIREAIGPFLATGREQS